MTEIILGMSGSLKATTMKSKLYDGYHKVWSDTKNFFKYDEEYFSWRSAPNDAHLAIHRLLVLDLPGYLPHFSQKNTVIERSISDNIFCVPNRKLSGLESYDNMDIRGLIDLEKEIISRRTGSSDIRKKILFMKDADFIENNVLSGPEGHYRRAIYPDVRTYIEKQREYIEFTLECHKDIKNSDIIRIYNAREYINNLDK